MKIAFVCTENAYHSQIAEVLAKKMFPEAGIEFISGGTHSTGAIDDQAIQVLKEEGIHWKGNPRSLREIGKPDVMVTMGCDVVCPFIPGARAIEWDIPDPKEKGIEEYHYVEQMIKEKLLELVEEVKTR